MAKPICDVRVEKVVASAGIRAVTRRWQESVMLYISLGMQVLGRWSLCENSERCTL